MRVTMSHIHVDDAGAVVERGNGHALGTGRVPHLGPLNVIQQEVQHLTSSSGVVCLNTEHWVPVHCTLATTALGRDARYEHVGGSLGLGLHGVSHRMSLRHNRKDVKRFFMYRPPGVGPKADRLHGQGSGPVLGVIVAEA